ncbi:MAG: nucleotidyl transferase AbiEii/AbiGii toxin family protein [Coprothermobacterota bacterium]|nr:nucleotidyl transferase AbiEii/AbiGii toxin family protein [Coprothermobacterota bacterium]
MSGDSVKDMAASVKSRLLSIARRSGKPFQSLLTHYGMERFLFRLSQSPLKENFILKGGLLLVGLGLPQARTTSDIDFLGLMRGDLAAVGKLIREIGSAAFDDGLVYEFDDFNVEGMSENAEYPGIRLTFDAWLSKARIPMQIDVGFGDAVVPDAREMTFPTLLDMEPPVVKAYSIETIIAEKFEASLDLAELNSRMKDFYDIWMLSGADSFYGSVLQNAIMATCQRRGTALSSQAVVFSEEFSGRSDKQTQWIAFLRKAQISGIVNGFPMIMASIGAFLRPVAYAIENSRSFEKQWPPGGPWQPR